MKKEMDKIQFEYRYEVQELMKVIDKYVKQNPAEKENKTLERFFDLLDVMDMEWKAAMNKTRPKQLSFRVSEEEYQQLQQKISESGKNQQEYILSCVLEKQIVNTDGIKELIPELKRIGNNLNQIAKRCNEGGMLPSEAEVRKHGEELNKVWQSLRRYLQRRA